MGFEDVADALDFGGGQVAFGGIQQGSHEFFRGIVEEGSEEATDGAAFSAFGRFCGEVNEAAMDAVVFEVAFVFEDAEDGANGGVAWGAGEPGLDIGGGGLTEAVEDFHDFAFAAAEPRRQSGIHMQFLQQGISGSKGKIG